MGSEGCGMSVSNTVCVITGSALGLEEVHGGEHHGRDDRDGDCYGENEKITQEGTDTEIVSSVDTKDKPQLKGHIQKFGGLMTPEYVAEGFYRLVTQCSNGSAMAVLKGSPYIIIPDYNQPMIISIVMMAKILQKVLGPDVVTRNHQILCFMFLLLIIGTLLAWII